MNNDSGSDSDFYGPPETVARLQERARQEDTKEPPRPARSPARSPARTPARDKDTRRQLHNPFAGVAYAWQLGESVDDFVARLPPATTTADEHTPWIYICNPFVARRKKALAGNQLVAGCEDEGTEADGTHTMLFVEGARERLDLLGGFLGGLAKMSLPPGAAAREADAARQAAMQDVLGLASHLGVTCGKWMLFVRPSRVNQVWQAVAHATALGELGIAAKVAPRGPETDNGGHHLVCIYTADFRDAADVGRVLQRLQTLGLVRRRPERRGSRDIYYKCDAYTYLGIGADNPWGLRASLFSASDVFARLEHAGRRQGRGP